jgi:hypothetical protein
MRSSGNKDPIRLRPCRQTDHIHSVTRMALKIAEEMRGLFLEFRYDRDIMPARCLCQDICKVWEFDPANVRRWKANPRPVGMPSLRHPGHGIHTCFTMGLAEAGAHVAAVHSGKGRCRGAARRTPSCTARTTRSGAWSRRAGSPPTAIRGLRAAEPHRDTTRRSFLLV